MEGQLDICARKLSELLDIPDTSDILQYVIEICNEQDLHEYLHGILDETNPDHKEFIKELTLLWNREKNKSVPDGYSLYRKETLPEDSKKSAPVKKKGPAEPVAHRQQDFTKVQVNNKENTSNNVPSHVITALPEKQPGKMSKKQKYVPLFSEEGKSRTVVHLPGRHSCDCQATKHQLVNNCLGCGRIVCSQEGSGPCLFCGELVCTNEERQILDRNSKASRQLLQRLIGKASEDSNVLKKNTKGNTSELQKAVEHKNKLLEFDRTVQRRTKVIDDQSDYFTLDNRWLSQEEREAIMKRDNEIKTKKEALRGKTTVTFDFAGRRIIEERENYEHLKDDDLQKLLDNCMSLSRNVNESVTGNENTSELPKPVYTWTETDEMQPRKKVPDAKTDKKMRLQDSELQQMSDEGWCLSMHQPYASLLIHGLKQHEGRVWYSALRGRLWIASTAKVSLQQDVRQLEQTIRILNKDDNIIFPSSYPVGALLGCVDVVDCLPQEEYRKRFPDGESDSPYVFICENPRELIVKFPVKGQHKIYKLDPRIHEAAKRTLKM